MAVLVGRQAPDFTTAAVLGNGEIVDKYQFHQAIEGKYSLVFFYPLDFTFVCPTELVALDHSLDKFHARNVEVIAASIDSQFSHNAWRNTAIKDGGIGPVRYTLVADIEHSVCRSFGVEHPDAGVALRAAFIIDRNKIIRAQLINDLPLGRNIAEILRLIDASQFTEKHGEVCPVNWNKGDKGIQASTKGVAEYVSQNGDDR